jgi:DNA-binding transcriptional regulator LsrR (DeoR family)
LKDDATPKQQEDVRQMNENWTGIQIEQIRACSERARKTGRPGVILVAFGKNKAEIVKKCTDEHLINELIVDYHLAKGLIDEFYPIETLQKKFKPKPRGRHTHRD